MAHTDYRPYIKSLIMKIGLNNSLPEYSFWLFIAAVVIMVFFCSCSPAKQAQKYYDKAKGKSLVTVAENTRKDFPCTVTDSDTITTVTDSLVYIDCPEMPSNNREEDYTSPGSVKSNPPKSGVLITANSPQIKWSNSTTYKVPVHLPVRTMYIRTTIEDSAKIYVLLKEQTQQVQKLQKLEGKVNRRGKWNLYLIILLLASLFLNFIQFRSK